MDRYANSKYYVRTKRNKEEEVEDALRPGRRGALRTSPLVGEVGRSPGEGAMAFEIRERESGFEVRAKR